MLASHKVSSKPPLQDSKGSEEGTKGSEEGKEWQEKTKGLDAVNCLLMGSTRLRDSLNVAYILPPPSWQ